MGLGFGLAVAAAGIAVFDMCWNCREGRKAGEEEVEAREMLEKEEADLEQGRPSEHPLGRVKLKEALHETHSAVRESIGSFADGAGAASVAVFEWTTDGLTGEALKAAKETIAWVDWVGFSAGAVSWLIAGVDLYKNGKKLHHAQKRLHEKSVELIDMRASGTSSWSDRNKLKNQINMARRDRNIFLTKAAVTVVGGLIAPSALLLPKGGAAIYAAMVGGKHLLGYAINIVRDRYDRRKATDPQGRPSDFADHSSGAGVKECYIERLCENIDGAAKAEKVPNSLLPKSNKQKQSLNQKDFINSNLVLNLERQLDPDLMNLEDEEQGKEQGVVNFHEKPSSLVVFASQSDLDIRPKPQIPPVIFPSSSQNHAELSPTSLRRVSDLELQENVDRYKHMQEITNQVNKDVDPNMETSRHGTNLKPDFERHDSDTYDVDIATESSQLIPQRENSPSNRDVSELEGIRNEEN